MSAFTIAFQVPNLVRSLFADAALQAAFVPVFTEQLEKRGRAEAFRVASALVFVISVVLGLLTALFVLLAPVIMPLFAPGFDQELTDLTVQPGADAVPDRAAARALGPGGGDPEQLRHSSPCPRSRRCSGTSRSSRRWSC